VINLTVTHDGKNWIAKNDELCAHATTLDALDSKVKRLLQEKGYLQKGKKVDVFMACDKSTIPQWMRQYSHHYFNRIVRIEG
jgi:hypothetical protein